MDTIALAFALIIQLGIFVVLVATIAVVYARYRHFKNLVNEINEKGIVERLMHLGELVEYDEDVRAAFKQRYPDGGIPFGY